MHQRDRLIAIGALLAGAVLLAAAIIYWADPASSLPAFMPGHEAGSPHHHVKHGIAAAVVALALFAVAWFRTGPSGRAR